MSHWMLSNQVVFETILLFCTYTLTYSPVIHEKHIYIWKKSFENKYTSCTSVIASNCFRPNSIEHMHPTSMRVFIFNINFVSHSVIWYTHLVTELKHLIQWPLHLYVPMDIGEKKVLHLLNLIFDFRYWIPKMHILGNFTRCVAKSTWQRNWIYFWITNVSCDFQECHIRFSGDFILSKLKPIWLFSHFKWVQFSIHLCIFNTWKTNKPHLHFAKHFAPNCFQ